MDGTGESIIACYIKQLTRLGLAEGTKTVYTGRLRALAHWLQEHAGCDLLQADDEDLLGWRDSLTVADRSVESYVAAVRGFYRWAREKRYIDASPADNIPVPKKGRRYPRPIGENDLEHAIDCAGDRVRPWLVLAAYAGLRCCEIARLRREDVLETAPTPALVVLGKGDKERIVAFGPYIWSHIRVGLPSRGWLYTRFDGKPGPVSAKRVSEIGNEHLRACGLHETMHQLRHRFGTIGYNEGGMDIIALQEVMGHSSVETTRLYAAHSPAAAAAIVLAVEPKRRGLRQVRKKPGEG
jgi:integrase